MIPTDAEQIIRAAATSSRAFWQLVTSAAENPPFRLQLLDARVTIDAELRGETVTLPPPNILEPIATAVDRELEAMRPAMTIRVAQARAFRRLSGCGYVQLSLSDRAHMRRELRRLIKDSGLTAIEFARAIGITNRALSDHLNGKKIPASRRTWYRSIETILVRRRTITIVLKRTPSALPGKWKRG